MADTIDSNVTGLRIAEEETPGVLPTTPIWDPLEPNSYDDFGGNLTMKARRPINPTRQLKKGNITDLDASGGLGHDFTEKSLFKRMQGFLFSRGFTPADTIPFNGNIDGSDNVAITSAANSDSSVNAAAGLDIFATDDIVLLSGFAISANNGVKTVASAVAAKITFDQAITDEGSPPASARVEKVGVQCTDLSVVVSGNEIFLDTAGAIDFTTDVDLVQGSWIFIGSDDNSFAAAGNQCFARVDTITATRLTLGKTTKQMVADAGPTAVDLMLPNFIRNEPDPDDIVKITYQLERTLGRDVNGVMSEYLPHSVANELTINTPVADLMTADLSFVSADNEQRDGATGVKTGTRPSVVAEDAFNTSSDVKRFRLSQVVEGNPFPSALFGYATEGTIAINNNVSPNKAIGVLGAFAMTAGVFEVTGQLTAYFSSIDAVQAVRNNADVTLDMVLVKDNAGWVVDIPLLSLGDGRLNVEADQPITLPLETSAAESVLGHTLMMAKFSYLPDLAA